MEKNIRNNVFKLLYLNASIEEIMYFNNVSALEVETLKKSDDYKEFKLIQKLANLPIRPLVSSLQDIDCIKMVSKVIKELSSRYDYEKAISLAEKFQHDIVIKTQLISLYFKRKDKRALKLAHKHMDIANVRSIVVDYYLKNDCEEDALNLCKNYEIDEILITMLADYYCKKSNVKSLFQIYEAYKDNIIIKSIVIRYLINNKKTDLALKEIKGNEEHRVIRSQLINFLIDKSKYEEALELTEGYLASDFIISQRITLLDKLGRYDEIKNLVKYSFNNTTIRKQVISLAFEYEDYDYVIEICNKFLRFPGYVEFKNKAIKLKEDLNHLNKTFTEGNILEKDFEKIKNKTISHEELIKLITEKSEIEQLIYLAAFTKSHMLNETNLLKKLKKIKLNNEKGSVDHAVSSKLINLLNDKKHTFFDIDFYLELLKSVNKELDVNEKVILLINSKDE